MDQQTAAAAFEPRIAAPDALRDALFADPDLVAYAVIDGAAVLDLGARLQETGAESACLFLGELEPELAAAAPWLVRLTPKDGLFDQLFGDGWGKSWAIFATSRASLTEMRRRLRKLTLVELPDRRTVYFRFYDPRVLRHVLPLMEPAQLKQFFGDEVDAYFCEDEGGAALLEFRRPIGAAPAAKA